MTALSLTAPDGSAWPVETRPTAGGVVLAIGFMLGGQPVTLELPMVRASARELARSLNADAGDAIERTFNPDKAEAPHG